jgi:hypothetical protein
LLADAEGEGMAKQHRRTASWTYREVSKAIPRVRRLLATLRESYIAYHMLSRQARRHRTRRVRAVLGWHRDQGEAALAELRRLYICLPHNDPLRGVVLFPATVVNDETEWGNVYSLGYFVYRDTRDAILTFALPSDLEDCGGVNGAERPVPDAVRRGASRLTLDDVPPLLTPEPLDLP